MKRRCSLPRSGTTDTCEGLSSVVLRVHGGPAADRVSHEPEFRRDGVDIADLAGVPRIALGPGALRLQDRGKRPIDIAVEERRFSFGTGRKVVEEVPRHPVHRESSEGDMLCEINESAVVKRFLVGVGRDDLAEEIIESVVRVVVGHKVDKFLQP
jgi:hypothetical protein